MTLSYETCVRLKEAGFPFKEADTTTSAESIFVFPMNGAHNWMIPTLSELIEECGEDSVLVLTVGRKKSSALHGVKGTISIGETPEGALSELYLSLHTPNKTT